MRGQGIWEMSVQSKVVLYGEMGKDFGPRISIMIQNSEEKVPIVLIGQDYMGCHKKVIVCHCCLTCVTKLGTV